MRQQPPFLLAFGALAACVVLTWQISPAASSAPPAPAAGQGQGDVSIIISDDAGAPPRLAVPDFIPTTADPDVVAVAKTVAQVLWDDLVFEREFDLIPRDTYRTIPAARSASDVPFDRWRELGADGVIVGTVEKTGTDIVVQVRLYNVRSRQAVFAEEYRTTRNPRLFAHTAADKVHLQQRGLRGVARTKLAFSSDRDGDRVVGTVEKRDVKEIYIADYDGANQQRLTTNRSLNVFPVWTPDGRGILYTSFVPGYADLLLARIYEGIREEPTKSHQADRFGHRPQNSLGMVSPDGRRIVFASNRDGNYELYVMDRDGGNVFRLTNHSADDITPTWNPQGTHVAFTSNRRGAPNIYTIAADGTNLAPLTYESYADRATWSPLGTEIAFAAQAGPGFVIKVIDLTTREVRQLTFGPGTDESPAFAPNGRHIAFSSTRAGRYQVFTMARDGKDIRQVTRTGGNFYPNWSE